jgi:hypothetical protein
MIKQIIIRLMKRKKNGVGKGFIWSQRLGREGRTWKETGVLVL